MARVEIMLGDGNPLVLSAMSEVFERDPRFSLVATTATAEGFLGMAMRVPIQVGVIDWNLPALGAEKLTEVLRAQERAPRVVIYGHDQDPALPRRAMAVGAAAFVSRSAPIDKLVQTCLDVAEGKMVFPFLDVRELRADPISTLSRKERLLLEALAEGLTNKQLAARLGISTNTVKFHLSNVFDKLSVKNRAQAIAFYYSSQAKG
ncbi:response regulator transcription factor [Ruegeria pomeroyi]|uniref:Response regulator transcription factor n=1 Tax=Ruegeria pomeroyi TaxID=89184 RepID=A0A9Q3ZPH7_9RHOB|nr:response regulator transcription factor [Ruegeria pomeroyi]MCE8515055.1 response regulator transcription factor [Ruegeria pomeroyi]MCE8519308.1 response regulator transcription factor [Ruegeria pomeroyi]MCE8523617.1 response regulator transcription factor [Ruegeria pomeroyi]MCE8525213.1 response regulator transcription factor [Ruegeria pomeroyi]MCE8531713.1 response regulator transcription factor [Ruegeria pomeroyi]